MFVEDSIGIKRKVKSDRDQEKQVEGSLRCQTGEQKEIGDTGEVETEEDTIKTVCRDGGLVEPEKNTVHRVFSFCSAFDISSKILLFFCLCL